MLKSQKYILDFMKEVGGQDNHDIYKELFAKMSTKEYKEWVEKFVRPDRLHIMVPHEESNNFNVSKMIGVLDGLGGKVFGKMEIEDKNGIIETLVEYYVIDLAVRIPTQTVDKGAAVSDSKSINPMTGQMSSASKITSPETGLLFGLGLTNTLKELVKLRGGDQGLQSALNIMLSKTGNVSMEDIQHLATGRTSTETLDAYFKAIHIKLFDDM